MGFVYSTYLSEPFHRFRRLAGVDRAVFYAILSKGFLAAGSLITIPLILTRLTSVEQGFFYTFGSILALQVFLEMGFGTVAIQLIAHDAANLNINLTSGISGSALFLNRFSATIRFVQNWYAVLALLVGIFLFPVGYWFFYTSSSGSSAAWLFPWVIMVLAAAGAVYVNGLSSVIEGMGFVAESIRLRLFGSGMQVVLTIAGLLAGFGLYSVPLASFVALSINFTLAWRLLRNIFKETSQHGKETRVDWRTDVLPFQWRISVSWISGWFICNAMLPVVFRQFGPEEAGRFGLALNITGFISALSINWTSTKSAIWGQMASKKDWASMDTLFWKVMPQAIVVAASMSAIALLILPHLEELSPKFIGRVPELRVLFALCLVVIMNQVTIAEALYLRAHRSEPFLVNSVSIGLAMAIGLFALSHSSTFSISGMYAVFTFIGLIWGSMIFAKCRSRWHCPGRVGAFQSSP